ncbi:mandelate racemase/muconate lactonizing enzyme family protein [Neolewinella aurantiaca]|uniref:Mandelate racemase/muconate lactonizing enzyme family protein n=1 Tax=Neolewinella aurantiaca TaxID=2602767 RepID=A0A5C7FKU1_9BACT|nr:mandelate racemase/muconate lactonizing enzyme family protein [Neolewinella aurantiaca]TXF87970.1 mandelate racemase/muconate lactonizing enzyme family protein [Neolewinella aurantiaca]
MKIANVETYLLSDKLEESFFFSQWTYAERRICVVKVTTACGIVGWGEGYGPADVLEAGIEFLQPLLIGKNPLEQESIWFDLYRKSLDFARRGILVASISAIDLALWDIKGKHFGQPVSVLLGGRHRERVTPYATGLYFSEGEGLANRLALEAVNYVKQGFKAIKMKVGLTIERDLENVRAVRAAIGDKVKLMVDANHAYSLREATELARKIEQYDIGWFEEPVSPEFYHHYTSLRQKTTIPISGGECEYLRYGHHQLLKNESVDILQVDICSAGGLTEAKRIAALASTYGVEIIPHTWGTGIAFHAALHFIANLEPVPGRLYNPEFYIEYDRTSNGIRERLTCPSIEMEDGCINVPKAPGLGIEVNEDALAFYAGKNQNGLKVG